MLVRLRLNDGGEIIVRHRWLPVCMHDRLRRPGERIYKTTMRDRKTVRVFSIKCMMRPGRNIEMSKVGAQRQDE